MKQRIVGAILLTVLAVIFVPMVLDEGPERNARIVEFDLPETPDKLRFTTVDLTQEPTADMPQVPAAITPPDDPPPEPPAERPREASKAAAKTPAKTEPPASPEVQKQETTRKQAPPPASGDWAVQAASFMERANAVALRDSLISKGYQAYLQTGKTPGGRTVYRVRLGPEADRAAAEALRQRLNQSEGLNGLVVKRDEA